MPVDVGVKSQPVTHGAAQQRMDRYAQGLAQEIVAVDAELVIANIHYPVMKGLIASEGFLSKKGFILSGLLRSQAREIEAELSRKPVKIIKKWELEGIWYTFFGKIT